MRVLRRRAFRYRMNAVFGRRLLPCAPIKCCIFASIVCFTAVGASNSEELLLKVTLVDPGATTDIQATIAPQKPFDHSEMHNGARFTIKGELAARRKGSYRLTLTIAEWRDEKTNSTEQYDIDLTPGKPESRGFISSFVYHRVILLTNIPKG